MKTTTAGERLLMTLFYSCCALFAIACLIPFLIVLGSSLTDETALLQSGYRILPQPFSWEAYTAIFATDVIYNAYSVTLFVTIVGTALSLLMTSAVSYAVSVKTVKYRNSILFFIWFTMLFNGGLVPWYILISKYLHLSNSIWVMILPALVNPWFMFLLRNFFMTLPDSLAESAKIDGANDIYILFRIVLPLSLPALATISLFYALDYWNEWFKAILFIDDPAKYPLQSLIIRIISSMNFTNQLYTGAVSVPSYTIRMATVILTIGPIVLLYPFIQKYFVQGLTVGAVKG
ncbi:multiple sugar transport system permease protein [Paenibacillus sp. UNCCL117]|uniref:carbohydrate ABC transporter permease n=1 Tax=unclassified Paenibacillus TaxID=185978 RepID=UPI000882A20C|nr:MULTISPECIES: carbohydrate ABC transporter permease [unclassified Paenibacillus]SDC43113.1 multiple sugar transport system permease protein [Paenibacillus sp. cl123]SFW13034.1 multiple sugar transport system permease protein [Paenibacillus sp. UNCCL117]